MNKITLSTLLLPREKVALEMLSDGLLADINARLARIMRKLGVKRDLELFEVAVVGIQLTIEIDDETREYLLDRSEISEDSAEDSDVPDYYS